MMSMLSPAEITASAVILWEKKAHAKFWDTCVSGILAWMYIALWATFSITSISGLQHTPFGLTKIVAWLTFSLGLILVMIAWAELFTGNALLVIARLKKKISRKSFVKNLTIVYLANFVWALGIVCLLYVAQWHVFGDSSIWYTLTNLVVHKLEYGFRQAFSLGILCNILVCLWVWLAYSGKSTVDKIAGIVFPVTAFVACGFEHSVANMFYLPFVYLLKAFWFVPLVWDLSSVTVYNIFVGNLLPVSIGNLVGWSLFVGVLYRYLYQRSSL